MTIDSNLERKSVTSLPFKQFLAQLGVNEIHGLETLRLIKMCANAYETVTSEHLRTEQISEQRWRLLLRLLMEEQHGNPTVNPTHLANTQQVSKNTISSLLRSLEEQGFIERTLDQDDRRQFHIRLTEAGRQLVRDSLPVHITFLNQLTNELSRDEVNNLHQLLQRLHSSIQTCL